MVLQCLNAPSFVSSYGREFASSLIRPFFKSKNKVYDVIFFLFSFSFGDFFARLTQFVLFFLKCLMLFLDFLICTKDHNHAVLSVSREALTSADQCDPDAGTCVWSFC